jgi:hypothetical protein
MMEWKNTKKLNMIPKNNPGRQGWHIPANSGANVAEA